MSDTKISQMVVNAPIAAWDDDDGMEVSTGLPNAPVTKGITKKRLRKDLFTIDGVIPAPAHGDTITRRVNSAVAADDDWVIQRPSSGWRSISITRYTVAHGSSTSQIACSVTTDFAIGLPVRVTQGGTPVYGIITAIDVSSITIAGAPITALASITDLSVGVPGLVTQLHLPLTAVTNYGTGGTPGTNSAVLLQNRIVLKWDKAPAFLVKFSVVDTVTQAVDRKANILIGGLAVGTDNSNDGPTINPAGGIWTSTGADAISAANYDIAFGNGIEVKVVREAATSLTGYLNVLCTFVFA